jgi:Reverse transcriptase (RNA-dependent DNA polymerase)
LLNVSYKIISKAINNRLKKVSGRILSRAQKGFTNNQYIQECIINILEAVSFCNESKTKGFLLAIDQAKAFDTVDHNFIRETYKFFGFDENFIKLLEITTMGRNATIMFDNNEHSKKIDLGTGYTQGNGPSPLLFNFCQQILIFKLEFSPWIREIEWPCFKLNIINTQVNEFRASRGERRLQAPDPDLVPVPVPEQLPAPANLLQGPQNIEGANQPAAERDPVGERPPPQPPDPDPDPPHQVLSPKKGKVEGFADDTSVLGKAEARALTTIKQDLLMFTRISGLKVNFEKCILIPIGITGDIPEYFYECGFKVANSATILGFEVHNSISEMSKNFDRVITKLIPIRNYWTRFNLSLPGRIA